MAGNGEKRKFNLFCERNNVRNKTFWENGIVSGSILLSSLLEENSSSKDRKMVSFSGRLRIRESDVCGVWKKPFFRFLLIWNCRPTLLRARLFPYPYRKKTSFKRRGGKKLAELRWWRFRSRNNCEPQKSKEVSLASVVNGSKGLKVLCRCVAARCNSWRLLNKFYICLMWQFPTKKNRNKSVHVWHVYIVWESCINQPKR